MKKFTYYIFSSKIFSLWAAFKKCLHAAKWCWIVFLLLGMNGFAQNNLCIAELKSKAESLNAKPDSALFHIERALMIAREERDSTALSALYISKGNIFSKLNPDRAVKYYYKALKIAESQKYPLGIATAKINIGGTSSLPLPEKLKLIKQATRTYLEQQDTSRIIKAYITMASTYLDHGDYTNGTIYVQKLLNLSGKANDQNGIASAYDFMAYAEIEYKKDTLGSLDLFKTSLRKRPLNMLVDRLITQYNIMNLYFSINMPDSAMYYYDLIQDKLSLHPPLEAATYNFLSRYYAQEENIKKILLYQEKEDSVRNYIHATNNENVLRLLEIEHEAKIREGKVVALNARIEKADLTRWFLGILLALTIIFSTIVYIQQRQKSRKKRKLILEEKARIEAERRFAESELEHAELKKKYLSDELEYTNKELTSFASTIVQNQTLLDDFKKNVSSALKEKSIGNIKNQLRELNLRIQQIFSHNAQRSEFIRRSSELNHSLIFHLKTQFPELTDNDINFLILILLRFSSKEISAFYNISAFSVKQRRYRLRRKLGIENQETFESFFKRVLPDM